MSRKQSLSTQTGKLFIVIRKTPEIMKDISCDNILSYCKSFGVDYAFIEHNHDIDPITGLVEGKHYHIVMNAIHKDKRLSTHLNDLCSYFGFTDNNGICIEKYGSYEGSLQYLLHKNNPEKTQHDISEIVTNIDKGDLQTYISVDLQSQDVNFDYIYSICLSSKNIIEIIKQIGLSNYQRYRSTIWDIVTYITESSK